MVGSQSVVAKTFGEGQYHITSANALIGHQ